MDESTFSLVETAVKMEPIIENEKRQAKLSAKSTISINLTSQKVEAIHRRRALSLETKAEIIREVESTKRQKNEIAKEYGISQSTLSTIYKNKDKIMNQYKCHNISLKRVRTSSIGEVEDSVLRWYRDACSKNASVSGPMVKTKAKELAQVLGRNEFKASNGWLERFKSRHNIHFKAGGKDKSSIGMAVVRDWQQHELPSILQQYSPRDIFVAGESGFLYHLLPDDLLRQKVENVPLPGQNKDRLTALLCCNMDGSEKEKLLLIGRFPNPRSFKGVKSLPVTYGSDKRALMNAILFEKWFLRFDEKMKWQQRKVLLFIDNCPAHHLNVFLQATEVRFLPPNTGMYHPLVQGVKQVTKCYYRRRLLQHALAETNVGERRIATVRDAADMLSWAWDSVSPVTIMGCFRKSGFIHPVTGDILINLEEYTHQAQVLNKLIAAYLQRCQITHKMSALEYIDIDEFLPICEETWNQTSSINEWVPHTTPQPNNDNTASSGVTSEDVDMEECGQPPPKPKDVLGLVRSLRTYFQSQENVPGQVFSALASIEDMALNKMTENTIKVPSFEPLHF
uniref:HTH CENPB-type domain-containing protein n=1 Tax=Strigamia maritima TaxID=126957 RepID=T1JMU9_STRMM